MTNEDYKKYINLVYFIAKKYEITFKRFSYDLEDIVQVALLELCKKIDKYNNNANYSKNTYVYNVIVWSIERKLHNLSVASRYYKNTISLDLENSEGDSLYSIVPSKQNSVDLQIMND